MSNVITLRTDLKDFGRQLEARLDVLLNGPITKKNEILAILGAYIGQQTQITFRNQGKRDNHERWVSYNNGKGISHKGSTTRTKAGTWNIRYGTDLQGRPKGTYKRFKLRPGVRRYSRTSKLLQASNSFRQSFKILRLTDSYVIYGSRHKNADGIQSGPTRQVVFMTDKDYVRFRGLVLAFFKTKMK